MLSSTLASLSRRTFWNVRTTPSRATWCGGSWWISRSPRRMLPVVSFNRPVIKLTTVVFPAPLGPISPVIRPGPTVMERSCTACTPPNRRDTPARLSAAIGSLLNGSMRAGRTSRATACDHNRIYDAVRQIDDGEHDQRAEEDHPVLGERSRDLGQQREDHGADDRSRD